MVVALGTGVVQAHVAYAASKFALEGWMEALAEELAPFGITTTIVNPGFFRTQLLADESTTWPSSSIEDYAERLEQTATTWKSIRGRQSGDPAKLAEALIQVIDLPDPPRRWVAGADAVQALVEKADLLRQQATAFPELSTQLAHA